MLCGVDIVFYASLFDDVVVDVVNAVGSPRIAIAGLADAPGIDKIFFARLDHELIDFHSLDPFIANESPRHMSVTKKANRGVLIGETGGRLEGVKDVAPSLRRIESRMNNRKIADLPEQRKCAQPFLVRFA